MNNTLYHAVEQAAPERRAAVHALATRPPANWLQTLSAGLALVAALLLGAGLIFWIAANWELQTRGFKLVLIQMAWAASALLAVFCAKARTPALLALSLSLGGWLAFIGQSYQTGADAWQLFALWAALSLIWTLPQRSDVLWCLWVLVAALAITLWTGRADWLDALEEQSRLALLVNMGMWVLLAAVPLMVASLPFSRLQQGLGRWSWRLALGLAVLCWTAYAMWGVLTVSLTHSRGVPWVGMLLGAALVATSLLMSWRSELRDFVMLCWAALCLNVLGLAAVARMLLDSGNWIGGFLVLSVFGLSALGLTARWLLRLQASWEPT